MAETARPTRRYLRDDRVVLDTDRARARDESILGIGAGSLLALYVVSLMIPAEFHAGPIRLTPYTALLLVFIVPLFLHFLRQVSEGTNRLILLDVMMIAQVVLTGLAIIYNNGIGRAVFVVNQTVSLFGGYMVGRILIRRTTDYALFFRWFFYGLAFWLPFAMIELLTKRMLISEILAHFSSPLPRAGNEPRLGLNRVQAFMEHAITYGLLCSVGIANSYYILRDSSAWRYVRTGFFCFMTFISLSSAPVIAMGLQMMLAGWDRLFGALRYKWTLLVVTGVASALVVQLAAPHGIVGLVIENLAFDPTTGWGRTEILEYGSAEVARHPWLGIGLNDWIRPWYKKPSVDNFWLVTAMRYGLPAFLLLAGGIVVHLLTIATRRRLDPVMTDYRKGYLIAWMGVIFILATVHIWGAGPLFIMAYLGAGSIFYTGPELESGTAYRRRRALAEQGAERRLGAQGGARPARGGPRAQTPAGGAA
ncbi:O-antigen ligase family protein, partial [Amaricoccus solimangrovi]